MLTTSSHGMATLLTILRVSVVGKAST